MFYKILFNFSGKVSGNLETTYKCKEYGLTFTEKWSTDNKLDTTVELADKPLKGAKLVFDSTFSPQTGAKSGVVKTEYKQDMVTLTADVDLNLGGPLVNASAVVGHQGWLGGTVHKMWKFLEFSFIQILREINFWRILKFYDGHFAILGAPN